VTWNKEKYELQKGKRADMIPLLSVIIQLDRIIQVFRGSFSLSMLMSRRIHVTRIFLDSPIKSGNDVVYYRYYPLDYAKT
jgi:hypothetical protein